MKTLRLLALEVCLFTIAASAHIPNTVTVVIFDHADVPHSVLVSAAKEGRRLFRSVGVETEWIICDPTGGCYVPDNFIQIKILPRPVRTTPISSYGLASATTCGPADHCTTSHVFYDRVLAFADDASSPIDLTLAYVMMHEIGHVMGLGHQPGGIMTAAFTAHDLHRAENGWLSFTNDETRQLRTAVGRLGNASEDRHTKMEGWRHEFTE